MNSSARFSRKVYLPFKDGSSISYDGVSFIVHRRPIEIDADLNSRVEGEAVAVWRERRREIVRVLEEAWWDQEKKRKRDGAKKIYSNMH